MAYGYAKHNVKRCPGTVAPGGCEGKGRPVPGHVYCAKCERANEARAKREEQGKKPTKDAAPEPGTGFVKGGGEAPRDCHHCKFMSGSVCVEPHMVKLNRTQRRDAEGRPYVDRHDVCKYVEVSVKTKDSALEPVSISCGRHQYTEDPTNRKRCVRCGQPWARHEDYLADEPRLHVTDGVKIKCPRCHGIGSIYLDGRYIQCDLCHGEREIDPSKGTSKDAANVVCPKCGQPWARHEDYLADEPRLHAADRTEVPHKFQPMPGNKKPTLCNVCLERKDHQLHDPSVVAEYQRGERERQKAGQARHAQLMAEAKRRERGNARDSLHRALDAVLDSRRK